MAEGLNSHHPPSTLGPSGEYGFEQMNDSNFYFQLPSLFTFIQKNVMDYKILSGVHGPVKSFILKSFGEKGTHV